VHLLVWNQAVNYLRAFTCKWCAICVHLFEWKQSVSHLRAFTCWCINGVHLVVEKQLVNHLGAFVCKAWKSYPPFKCVYMRGWIPSVWPPWNRLLWLQSWTEKRSTLLGIWKEISWHTLVYLAPVFISVKKVQSWLFIRVKDRGETPSRWPTWNPLVSVQS
jgi:hypothetical protein